MLNELDHAGQEHLDAEYVAIYEAKAGYDPVGDVDVLCAHGLDRHATLVDLGAGTGQFAVAAAGVCRHVTAVDVSPAMLDVMRRRVDALGLHNVTVAPGGFLSYEHAGPPADAVFSRHALHQLSDFWKGVALERVHAMLRPGGTLRLRDLVYDFEPAEVPDRIEEWLAGATTDASRGWTAAELAEHVRDEHGTYRWLLEPLIEHAGFDILDTVIDRGLYAAYTCRRR